MEGSVDGEELGLAVGLDVKILASTTNELSSIVTASALTVALATEFITTSSSDSAATV